jgi:uridylate kinase
MMKFTAQFESNGFDRPTLCKENNMPILFSTWMFPGNLKKVIMGEKIGTL